MGTESSKEVPEESESQEGRIQARDVAYFPRVVQGRVVARKKSCRFAGIAFSLVPNPPPKRTQTVLPGQATRPRLPLPGRRASLRSLRSTLRSPKRCLIWRLPSQAPPPEAQRPRPPANERS